MKKWFWILFVSFVGFGSVLLYQTWFFFIDQQVDAEPITKRGMIKNKQYISRLSQAIQIPTISFDPSHNQAEQQISDPAIQQLEVFERFRSFLQTSFPNVFNVAGEIELPTKSVLLKFEGSDPELAPILFMAHMDVVPVDSESIALWKFPPFSGRVSEEKIWGRGALDDKASLMALLEAMEIQLTEGLQPKRTVYFAFGHDEEIGGKNGASVIADYFRKEAIQFEMILDEGGIIAEGILTGITQPVALIGIAEKGYADVKLSVVGKGGHSSMPPENTAAGVLAKAIVKIESHQFAPSLDFINWTYDKVGFYADFPSRLVLSNQWLFAPFIEQSLLEKTSTAATTRTTTAVNMLSGSSKSNVLPTLATAVVNFRLIPGDTPETVLSHIQSTINDPRVEIELLQVNLPSKVSRLDTRSYKILERTIRGFSKQTLVAPYLVLGGTDAKHYDGLSDAIYRFLMIDADQEMIAGMHGINEHISIAQYQKLIEFYYELLNRLSY